MIWRSMPSRHEVLKDKEHSVSFFKKFIVILLQLSAFSPHPSTPPQPIPPPSPHLYPPPWFCPCVLYSSSCKPLSPLSPPHSPLAIVTLFLISMSLVLFCLLFSFVDYVPVKGEIIWYLSLTAWLISLSIMLSSSIHAVAKDISSFFLSAAWVDQNAYGTFTQWNSTQNILSLKDAG